MSKTTTRVQLDLPEASFNRLKVLKTKTEAATYAEVMRHALRLYEAMIEESEAGNQLCLKTRSGDEVIYRPIF